LISMTLSSPISLVLFGLSRQAEADAVGWTRHRLTRPRRRQAPDVFGMPINQRKAFQDCADYKKDLVPQTALEPVTPSLPI
jgi:hypothetical protein